MVVDFDPKTLQTLYKPSPNSHKGQNGKLLLIGGSHLFHAASLWALNVASRIVDMVFYASVPENNRIVIEAKKEFRDGIVVPRSEIENYIKEADCVLIGPGLLRAEKVNDLGLMINDLSNIEDLEDEGEQTYYLTKYLLEKYPEKKWVIDAGALQMMEPEWLRGLKNVILTPHKGEFEGLESRIMNQELRRKMHGVSLDEKVREFAKVYDCVVLLKGKEDVVCSPEQCVRVIGGNVGMTKGGTGDVLAGLVAALACKNDLFLAASSGSYFNKKAGESLEKRVGFNFNSSDLVAEIPHVMK